MAEQQLVIDDVEKRCVTAYLNIQATILSPFKDSFHHTLSAWIHDSKQSPKLVGDHLLFDCSVDTHRLYNAVDIVRRKCSAAISDFVEETVNKLNQSHQKQNEKLINKVVHCWDKSKLALLEGVVNYRTSLAATHLQAFVRDYLRKVTLPILICVENFIQDCLYQPSLDLCAAWSIGADYTYWYTKRWSKLEELEREDYHEIDYINLLRQDLIRHHQFRMREAKTAKPSKSQITHQEYVARTPQLLQRLLEMEGVKEELRERFRHLRWMEDDVEDEDEVQEMEDGEQQEGDKVMEDGSTQLTIKYEVHHKKTYSYSVEDVHKPQDVKKGKILSIEISQRECFLFFPIMCLSCLETRVSSMIVSCLSMYLGYFQKGDFIVSVKGFKIATLNQVCVVAHADV